MLLSGNVFGSDFQMIAPEREDSSPGKLSPSADSKVSILPPLYLPNLDFEDPLQLVFTPTLKTIQTNLTLSADKVNDNNFRIQGTSSNFTAGFYSQPQFYRGENITLTLGPVLKNSDKDFQLSFNFHVEGQNDNYTLTFVNGPLRIQGWDNTHYYQKVNSSSGVLVNLPEFVASRGDVYSHLNTVIVAMSGNSSIGPTDFAISG